jgi:regulatory protein
MIITRLEELEKSKVKVYIDEEYAFLLYQKDVELFQLTVGDEISQKCYEEILEDTVYRRAQQKALAVLKFMDRSEQELRRKLAEAGYTPDIIDRTLSYVSQYGYINDARFAASYIKSRMNTKSKLVIKTELLQKGVGKEILNEILLEEYGKDEQEDAELVAIKKAIAKKTKSPENLNLDEKQKLMASLYRKGFDFSKIKQTLL